MVDDAAGLLHDRLKAVVLTQPILFVGQGTGGFKHAAVVPGSGNDGFWLSDTADRLARDTDGWPETCDLLLSPPEPAGPP